MLSDVLKLGDKIDVTHLDKTGKAAYNARTYVSQLIDFVSLDVIHIATPIVSSTPIILNVGENYQLCFYSSKGLFQCNCVILKNQREGNIIVAVVRVITNLEKYQRRQYFRLECIHDITYRVITEEEQILEKKLKNNVFTSETEIKECKKRLLIIKGIWLPAAMKDLSGGGTRFTSAAVHEKGDQLQLKFDLTLGSGIKNMLLGAEIVSVDRVVNRVGLYEYRVEFNDIINRDREDIIKYIFEQERKRR
jgi:c-di-GMP-binding flagellar brake protein YcgR